MISLYFEENQFDEQVPVVVIETGFAHHIEAERAQQLIQTSNGLVKCVIFLNIGYVPECGRLSALSRRFSCKFGPRDLTTSKTIGKVIRNQFKTIYALRFAKIQTPDSI